MNKILKITLLLILLYPKNIQAQSVKIENLSYLGQSITNCGNIYFNLSSTHNINFGVVLTRPYYDNNPNLGSTGKLRVFYWTGSVEIQINEYDIGINSWTISGISASVTKSINKTFSSDDFDSSTGGALYARFYDTAQNFIYSSCQYNIIKPEFDLAPDTLTIDCSDNNPKNFSVTNLNNVPGIKSYTWYIGTGWEMNGNPVSGGIITTTSNSIQLTPTTSLLSNIRVDIDLDGLLYPNQLQTTVTRGSFNPIYSISGVSEMCTSATYTINNLANDLTVTWSSSNNYIATIAPINSNQATLSKAGASGIVTISATVANACGQQKTLTKNVVVGNANVDMVLFANGVGETDYYCTSHTENTYEIFPIISGSTHQIRLRQYPNLNIVYTSNIITGNSGTVNYYPSPGWYVFEVARTNSCGTTDWFGTEVEYVDCSQQGGGEMEFSIFPNPTSETLTISKKETKEGKNAPKSEKSDNSSYKLYDFNANLVQEGIFIDKTIIDVSNYKKGTYILKIYSSNASKTYQIVVE